MVTHSSILAWEIPWTEEPGGLQSMGLQSQTWLSTRTHRALLNTRSYVTAQVTHPRYHGINEIRSIVIALIILCLPIYTLDLPVTAKHALLHWNTHTCIIQSFLGSLRSVEFVFFFFLMSCLNLMKESIGIRKIIQNVSIYIFYFSFDPFPCLYLGIIIPVYFVFSCFLPCSSFPNLVLKKKITLKIN